MEKLLIALEPRAYYLYGRKFRKQKWLHKTKVNGTSHKNAQNGYVIFFAKDLGTIAFQTSKKTISRAAKKDCGVPKKFFQKCRKMYVIKTALFAMAG